MSDIIEQIGPHSPANRADGTQFRSCQDTVKKVLANLQVKGGLEVCKDLQLLDGNLFFESGHSDRDLVIDSTIVRGVLTPSEQFLQQAPLGMDFSISVTPDSDPYAFGKELVINASGEILGQLTIIVDGTLADGQDSYRAATQSEIDSGLTTAAADIGYFMKVTRMGPSGVSSNSQVVTYTSIPSLNDMLDLGNFNDEKIQSIRDFIMEFQNDAVHINTVAEALRQSATAEVDDLAIQVNADLQTLGTWLTHLDSGLREHMAAIETKISDKALSEDERVLEVLLGMADQRRLQAVVEMSSSGDCYVGSKEFDFSAVSSVLGLQGMYDLYQLFDASSWMFDSKIVTDSGEVLSDEVDTKLVYDHNSNKMRFELQAMGCNPDPDSLPPSVAVTAIFCGDESGQLGSFVNAFTAARAAYVPVSDPSPTILNGLQVELDAVDDAAIADGKKHRLIVAPNTDASDSVATPGWRAVSVIAS